MIHMKNMNRVFRGKGYIGAGGHNKRIECINMLDDAYTLHLTFNSAWYVYPDNYIGEVI